MVATTPTLSSCLPVRNPTASFWHQEKHELHDQRTTESLPVFSDVVIIGAGYTGISTAYHLVKGDDSNNKLSVAILEARGVCSGASGRNGGHLRPDMYGHIPTHMARGGIEAGLEIAEFEIAHLAAVKKLIAMEKIDCDFTLTRSVDVWCNQEAANKAKKVYDLMVARKLKYMDDVFFVEGKEAEGLSGVKGAKACATFTAATMWPYKLILSLTKSILETGLVNLQTNTPVLSIGPDPLGGFVITTPRGTTRANKIVHASNGYVAGLLPEYKKAIVPCKGICSHIAVPSGKRAPLLNQSYLVREENNACSYLVPRTDGSIVVGGANSLYKPFLSEWYNNIDDSILIETVKDHYKNWMQKLFYDWENSEATVQSIWTGVMGYSWDSAPHVGAVPEKDGQFIAAGFNGHGMPVIFLAAKGLAKMLLTGNTFAEVGLPKLYETSKKRLEKMEHAPEGGDILN